MIEIYTKKTCPYCLKAKNLLDEHSLEYVEKDISLNPGLRDELLSHIPGAKKVPQILDKNGHDNIEIVGGYEDLVSYLEAREQNS